jgi:hypothetical protein
MGREDERRPIGECSSQTRALKGQDPQAFFGPWLLPWP